MTPSRLMVDAGPLIALFHKADPDHQTAVEAFRHLSEAGARLLCPMPVVFEVYKWLLFHGGAKAARRGLEGMLEALEVVPLGPEDLEALRLFLFIRPSWRGTLEDGSVALLALRLKVPVWTFNYRDLGGFAGLIFWNP